VSNSIQIKDKDLVFHILNVGDGDNIIVELPLNKETGKRPIGIIDCYKYEKTVDYVEKIKEVREVEQGLEFLCATHPHGDHINGMVELLANDDYRPKEFWDSGFRHDLKNHQTILQTISTKKITMIRCSAGLERYFGNVQVTFLAPSISLRNRFGTYGVDVNNASIVLRFENHGRDVVMKRSLEYVGNISKEIIRAVNPATAILAGDSEYDSWSYITDEFPRLEKTEKHEPLVSKMINYLSCNFVKVGHHGSMHSSPLDVYEIMQPKIAVISTKQEIRESKAKFLKREMFPHESTKISLIESGAEIMTTDGSYDYIKNDEGRRILNENAKPGSIIVVLTPHRVPRWKKLKDDVNSVPQKIPKYV
jgi:beta-lactamase superfamily II metal-dependent hydrolase